MNKNHLSKSDTEILEAHLLTVDERQYLERLWSARPDSAKKLELGLLGRIVLRIMLPAIVASFAANIWLPSWQPAANLAAVLLWIISLVFTVLGVAVVLATASVRYDVEERDKDADDFLCLRSNVALLPRRKSGAGHYLTSLIKILVPIAAVASGYLVTGFIAALAFICLVLTQKVAQENIRKILSFRIRENRPIAVEST